MAGDFASEMLDKLDQALREIAALRDKVVALEALLDKRTDTIIEMVRG